jgi:hypothetical protein
MGEPGGLRRRELLERTAKLGLAALVADALPLASALAQQPPGGPVSTPGVGDATFQAFADTMIPGRVVDRTESGRPVAAGAILGVDPEPGAVEADALDLAHHPKIGFGTLMPPFLADLESRASRHGGPFLSLGWEARVATCVEGTSFDNPSRVLWEAAAAVPFTAFCAAAVRPEQVDERAVGYAVMGYPGANLRGYRRTFSYKRRLARERTRTGNLP